MTALRLLGATLVVCACAGWGLGQAARLRQRAAALSAVCKTLEQLRGEIVERRTPLRELALQLSREAPPSCRAWFSALSDALEAPDSIGFAAVWRETLQARAQLPLHPEELECLCLLGLSLGRYDAPEQGAAIDRCLRELESAHEVAQAEARERGRLFPGLGLAAGLLLTVLLL